MSDNDDAGRDIDVVPAFSRADRVVDAVARDMTRGGPSPQLRLAVRARIEQRRWRIGPAWLLAVASAAALALVAVIVGRGLSGSPGGSGTVRPAQVAHAEPPRVEQVSPTVAPHETIRAARAPRRRQSPVKSIEITPLVIEPLAIPRLTAGTSSGVVPIEIDPLQIVPLQQQ